MADRSSRTFRTGFACVCALVLLACAAPRARAGVSLVVSPANTTVAPGGEFDLTLDVTPAGSTFNGFSAVVAYDTTALTFVPAVYLSNQQGCLMTGACSAACGTTWHRFAAAADSLAITDLLLCDQIALTGPGTVYKLHFKAKNVARVTWVRLRTATFYDAGVYVTPVATTDARVAIGVSLGVDDRGGAGAGLGLRAEPNPARGAVAFALEAPAPGIRALEVRDVAGRLVRRLAPAWGPAGVSRLAWDGRDESGVRVPAGVYLVSVRTAGRSTTTRVTLLGGR